MKKGLLLLVAAATTTILVSCGGGNEAEAAKEYCDCFSDIAQAKEDMANAGSATEMLGMAAEAEKLAGEAQECEKKWREKYDGKIDISKFKEELKKEDEKVYKMAEELGAF